MPDHDPTAPPATAPAPTLIRRPGLVRRLARVQGPSLIRRPGLVRLAPMAAVLASMSSVQLGSALSVPLFPDAGVVGVTWLRLTLAGVVLLVVVRPGMPTRADLPAAALGLVMAGNAVAFSAATDRIPLGVTVAVEFCGPLTVAALGGRRRARRGPGGGPGGGPAAGPGAGLGAGLGAGRLLIPAAAFAGVVLITRPWAIGDVAASRTWLGLACAGLAALGWAGYIVLTAHVGRRREGFAGLGVALAVAALALTPPGVVRSWPVLRAAAHGSPSAVRVLAVCSVAALLVPLAAYALEMAALRRLDSRVFGVWMAFEPAIGALVGFLLLGQPVTAVQVPGFALVVLAGVTAQRLARR